MKGEGGFALVLTLIITALLIALTAEFVNEVYVDTSATHNFVSGQQASLLADSGVAGGVKLIQLSLAGNSNLYTSLLDLWAQPLKLDDELGSLDVVIEDESGKLNLNSLSPDTDKKTYYNMAVRLFNNKKLKLSPDLLDALIDWIDVNDEPRPSGAESPYYLGLKPPYAPRNGPLTTLEELRLVKGFDAATVDRLRPFVTVYADPSEQLTRININTAPREVIAALDDGMSDSLTDNVLEFRKTTPFSATNGLGNAPGMTEIAGKVPTYSTTTVGKIFRITSRGRVKDTIRTIEAVVRVNTLQYLYWREY